MADQPSQDRAVKTRIISHMNNDHHESIVRYLQHYVGLTSLSACSGKLSDIDLGSLTISCRGKDYRIPLEPPMQSFGEARERVVELDRECRAALGQSDVTMRRYVPPAGLAWIPFGVCVALFLVYSQRWWFAQTGPVERFLGSPLARLNWIVQPYVFGLLVGIHGLEAFIFATKKLPEHSVYVVSSTFWLWTASVFVEGIFAQRRFAVSVKAQKGKQIH